jgi:hypothetical protein
VAVPREQNPNLIPRPSGSPIHTGRHFFSFIITNTPWLHHTQEVWALHALPYPFFSTWTGPHRSVQATCRCKTHLTETVQLIAYNDAISPAVQELLQNHARTSQNAGLLDSCFLRATMLQLAFPDPWHRQEIPHLGKVLPRSECQVMTSRSVHAVG